jgi:hypothetical protein
LAKELERLSSNTTAYNEYSWWQQFYKLVFFYLFVAVFLNIFLSRYRITAKSFFSGERVGQPREGAVQVVQRPQQDIDRRLQCQTLRRHDQVLEHSVKM